MSLVALRQNLISNDCSGYTSQAPALENNPDFWPIITGKFLFWSPNLVWLAVALFDYVVFPYDLEVPISIYKSFLR